MRLRFLAIAAIILAGMPASSATPSYTTTATADCLRPSELAAECTGNHWTTPTGGFGMDLTLRSPQDGVLPGWGRRTGVITISRTIPFTPDKAILFTSVQVQNAAVTVRGPGNPPAVPGKNAVVWEYVRVDHSCRCVRPGEFDYMGPMITTQQGDGFRQSIVNKPVGHYVGGFMDGWPPGSIRVTVTFKLYAYLGGYWDMTEPVPDLPVNPAVGEVRAILKGYVRTIQTVSRWP